MQSAAVLINLLLKRGTMNLVAIDVESASGPSMEANNRAHHDKKLPYRGDIDGLRAVAVLAVITFHFFPAKARGGFVGVDIFFVISGYLISSIIYKEIEAQSFSIMEFYVRRVRRIYPALFLVLVTVCAAGWIFLMPSAFVLLGKQIVGGAAFIANIVLWLQSGYFSVASASKPLLHLWSLGVEEQFYLVFPLICVLLSRSKSNWVMPAGFLAIGIGSMMLNVAFVGRYREAVFYLPFSRLWELLAGAALSLFQRRDAQSTLIGRFLFSWRHGIAFLGLALLVVSIFTITPLMSFPGWWGLLPTVGSVLIIAAGHDAWSNRYFLSCKPAVFIGLISYPLYLWHWPILSFARIATDHLSGTDLSPLVKLLLGFLSVVMAYLTYRLVELPVRAVRQAGDRRKGALVWFSCVLTAGLFGLVVIRWGGFPVRLPSEVVALDHDYQSDAERAWREGTCFLRTDQLPDQFQEDCVDPIKEGTMRPLVLVWGDSHAADLLSGFRALQGRSEVRLAQYTSGVCPPFVGISDKYHPACLLVNNYILDRIRALKPAVVVLSAYWDPTGPGQSRASRAAELADTIGLIKAAGVSRVFVIGSAPSWINAVPTLLVDAVKHDPRRSAPERLSRSLLEPHDDTLLKAATDKAGAVYIPLFEYLCDQTSCIVSTGPTWREVLTYDKAHFTEHGSSLVAEYLWRYIDAPVGICPTKLCEPRQMDLVSESPLTSQNCFRIENVRNNKRTVIYESNTTKLPLESSPGAGL